MKKISAWLSVLALIAPLLPTFLALAEAEELQERTVMFWLYGSDLERKHGYALDNLADVAASGVT